MLSSVFAVLLVEITNVKKQLTEKLHFATALKHIVASVIIKLTERNIMKQDGLQTEMVTFFVRLVMKKYLKKFVLIVFVEFVMCPQKNIVVVKEKTNFFVFFCRK